MNAENTRSTRRCCFGLNPDFVGSCIRVYTCIGGKSTGVYMIEKRRPSVAQAKRPRNAAATREAILRSALVAFSRQGYDGIGVREIAENAGVTAVLVNRYFGSKEELFAAAVEAAFADRSLFEGDCSMLSERLTAHILSKTEKGAEPINPFFLLLRSAPNPRAAEILRDSIARHFEQPLKSSLPGPRAGERAAIILAVTMGLSLYRNVIGSKALADAGAASVCADLRTMFQRLIDSAAGREPVRRSHAQRSRE
jgi:AcrR family transcriptional regulator